MLRKMPCTRSFLVYRDTHSAVVIWSSGRPESLRAAPMPATNLAPWRVSLLSRKPQPPPVTSTFLPPIRYRSGWLGFADVERCADLLACLLGDAADLDHDGAVVDLEAVDVVGRGAATDLVEALHDQGAIAAVGQPGGGEQAARARSDNDGIELCSVHSCLAFW